MWNETSEDEDEDDKVGFEDDLHDFFAGFNCYDIIQAMEDKDVKDLFAIKRYFQSGRRIRKVKFPHERIDWDAHLAMLQDTDGFESRFRMSYHHFEYLRDAIKDCISVDFKRSMSSTQGQSPIFPELVMACGLRFLGLDSKIADIADLYGMSILSCKRVIDMFLDAIDHNSQCRELQIELPDPSNKNDLDNLAGKWSRVSSAYNLMNGFIGAIDGWLPRTEMPYDVPNQVDYFSGHYQCYGLNVQAICDPDLIFLFLGVAAPGKVNDVRAFLRCDRLIEWLQKLPPEFYIGGDNAYSLSRRILIPFSGAEKSVEEHRTYNFYLSQLRVRIEMAFGLLTTKWRILRRPLNYSSANNARIIRVCARLHNFCIRMQQLDNDSSGWVGHIADKVVDPNHFGIVPINDGGNMINAFGYLPTASADDDFPESPELLMPLPRYTSLLPDNTRRLSMVSEIITRSIQRPHHNKRRNND